MTVLQIPDAARGTKLFANHAQFHTTLSIRLCSIVHAPVDLTEGALSSLIAVSIWTGGLSSKAGGGFNRSVDSTLATEFVSQMRLNMSVH
ncbi:hypothetical protein BV22DRAFT_892430 [Leucogyrophana mollusca]|uniref:Uncharacterized protein n=1 Tax=Leucogyrophana mollusca TaxID=85980 RepID=A0ACB8B0X6_9AGAM|nr:hypothetical protein BV22DRAFT_892430 [Leucogyrophana mollusca]